MSDRARMVLRLAVAAWILLGASIAIWPAAGADIGPLTAAFAFIPLFLPLHGIVRGSMKWLRAAPMALAPALALAITEILVNPPARLVAGATLVLAFLAFAAIVAALRSRAPG
jgi:uncharacterized membrane protein